MKKISMVLVATATIVFASCGGAAKTDNTTTNETATEVTEQSSATESANADVLAKYEEFVNKAVPLAEKVKAGDTAAIQEYTKLAEELSKFTMDNQTAFGALSVAEAEKYKELTEKLTKAFQ